MATAPAISGLTLKSVTWSSGDHQLMRSTSIISTGREDSSTSVGEMHQCIVSPWACSKTRARYIGSGISDINISPFSTVQIRRNVMDARRANLRTEKSGCTAMTAGQYGSRLRAWTELSIDTLAVMYHVRLESRVDVERYILDQVQAYFTFSCWSHDIGY